MCIFLYTLVEYTAAATISDRSKATENGLLITDKKDVIANIVLKDMLLQVEQQGQKESFTKSQKTWVLQKLSQHLFGDEEKDIVEKVVSSYQPRTRRRHSRRNIKGLARTKRDNAMYKLSFSQEYMLLVRLSDILREQGQDDDTSEHEDLLARMNNAG